MALDSMWLNLRKLFEQLSSDPHVRAVVISGAGEKAFTAGLDVQVYCASVCNERKEANNKIGGISGNTYAQ